MKKKETLVKATPSEQRMAPELNTLQTHLDMQYGELDALRNALDELISRLVPVLYGVAMYPNNNDEVAELESPIAMTIKRQTLEVRELADYVRKITAQLQI